MTHSEYVAQQLKINRTVRGWTQDELAERLEPKLGVRLSKQSVSAWEHGIKQFTIDEVAAFASLFKLPVSAWVLGGSTSGMAH